MKYVTLCFYWDLPCIGFCENEKSHQRRGLEKCWINVTLNKDPKDDGIIMFLVLHGWFKMPLLLWLSIWKRLVILSTLLFWLFKWNIFRYKRMLFWFLIIFLEHGLIKKCQNVISIFDLEFRAYKKHPIASP